MANLIGYRPSRKENGNKLSRLLFDGEETKYEIWETNFSDTSGLKDSVFGKNLNRDETDKERNDEAYAKLIQFLDNKS